LRRQLKKTELAGVLQDEFAVACLVAVELNARLARDQWLKQHLALDERQARHIASLKVQKIEGTINEPHIALAVGRRLGMGEARQAGVVNATEFAVEIGSLRLNIRKPRPRWDICWSSRGRSE
jgi:hypothetical protein